MAIITKNVISILAFADSYILQNTHTTKCVEILHWARWLFASTNNYLATIIENAGYTFVIEGIAHEEQQAYIEFRMDGPSMIRLNPNYYRLNIEINLLWSFIQDHSNYHESARMQGLLVRAMKDICIYRYGDDLLDDQSLLGILKLKNPINVNNFGLVNPETKLTQGTVAGSYEMHLSCN